MSTKTKLHGIYPILYSFFDDQGQLGRTAMCRQVEACMASSAHGITKRLGLKNGKARQPSVPVTDFGLQIMSHWAEQLGPL